MWYNFIIVISLTLLAGTFAGLTLALFSIELTAVERKMRLGNEQAKAVYRIRKHGNLLLCTLLLGNVACYTSMSIFLDNITSSIIAGFIATALIFVFGEILPQAVFPRYAMRVGAFFSWPVWLLMYLFYPISKPIAWLLDRLLGQEPPVLWSKQELQEIIKYHEDVGDGVIDADEERIILGALSFSEKKARDIMIAKKDVLYLETDTMLTWEVMEKVKNSGHSRIPIYNKTGNYIQGLLYTKDLIGILPEENIPVKDIYKSENLIAVSEFIKLDNILNILTRRKMHMAVVNDRYGYFTGIVTLEDIMEEILKTELEDRKK